MTPILLPVATEDVRHVWPQIRDRVAKLVGDLGEPCLPEDVYFELARGGTYLWTTDDVRGFIVVQVLVNPYSRTLHVWMASSEKGDWSPAVFDQIKAIATDNKCGFITFASDRTGWKRALRGIRATTLYTFEVGDSDGQG
jgi:hypothetical protein